MGKMKELFMHMRELEMQNEDAPTDNIDDEYHYEKYIQEKYKSPRHVCFMTAQNGELVMLQGNTIEELNSIADKHKLCGEFQIMSPKQHLF